jgi:hypothetical protein
MFSPKTIGVTTSQKHGITHIPEKFFTVLRDEHQLVRDKYFHGGQLKRKQLPYNNKINFIHRSKPKVKPKLHNQSDYLANTIKHKFSTINRLKPAHASTELEEVAKNGRRLIQLCADIETIKNLVRLEDVNCYKSYMVR